MHTQSLKRYLLRISLIAAVILAGLLPTHPASAGTTGWTRLLGSAYGEKANSIAVDGSGNIYLAGETNGNLDGQTNAGDIDAFVSKFDSSGTKQWTRLLGSYLWDQATGVAVDGSGNVYVVGSTFGAFDGQTNAGWVDVFLSKFDGSGTKQWTHFIGTGLPDQSEGITADGNGNIYIVGLTDGALDEQTNVGGLDAFISKYDGNGTRQWTRLLGSTYDDVAMGVAVDGTGNIYLAGLTFGNLDGQVNAGGGACPPRDTCSDAFLSKFTATGSKQWTRLLGVPGEDRATGVAVDSAGNAYLAGWTSGNLDGQTNAGSKDAFISRFDSSGTKQWTHLLGTPYDDRATGVVIDPGSGNIYLAGYTEGNLDGQINTGLGDAFVSKFNSTGTKQWTRLLGTVLWDGAYGVDLDSTGNVYVAGVTGGNLDGQPNAGYDDAFVSKLGLFARTTGSLTVAACATQSAAVAAIGDPRDSVDSLQLSIFDAPTGLNVILAQQQGIVTATATAACTLAPGTYSMTLSASNTHGETASTGFSVRMLPPPVLPSPAFLPLVLRGKSGGW